MATKDGHKNERIDTQTSDLDKLELSKQGYSSPRKYLADSAQGESGRIIHLGNKDLQADLDYARNRSEQIINLEINNQAKRELSVPQTVTKVNYRDPAMQLRGSVHSIPCKGVNLSGIPVH